MSNDVEVELSFKVLGRPSDVPDSGNFQAYLLSDNWDDWGEFATLYTLYVFDESGIRHLLGGVKIGQFGLKAASAISKLKKGMRWASIPSKFTCLDVSCFSLGQSEDYYEKLGKFSEALRKGIVKGLRDVVADEQLWYRSLNETVMRKSLLRGITKRTVEEQFRRLLRGGAKLSPYRFSYTLPKRNAAGGPPIELAFHVNPNSKPPTNIHVLVGPNGAGKTYTLNLMAKALVSGSAVAGQSGAFRSLDINEDRMPFANVVSVSFSAFDNFDVLDEEPEAKSGAKYSYIGLKRWEAAPNRANRPKSPEKLTTEFAESVPFCLSGARRARWHHAIESLEADPLFKEKDIWGSLARIKDQEKLKATAATLFAELSSGHKLVLLTIARLVEDVEEKTLVLLDEPESHLHPPLLAAFVRALSDLLVNRNGVAVVATHSPVVLQEVPKTCVWKFRRLGKRVSVERPEIETFGENTGILTREVFRLEVVQSGFHKLLHAAIQHESTYEDALDYFDGQLGGEARAILRGLMLNRQRRDS